MAERIGDGLVRIGAMTQEQVQQVLQAQKQGQGRQFGEVAVALGFVTAEALQRYFDSRQA